MYFYLFADFYIVLTIFILLTFYKIKFTIIVTLVYFRTTEKVSE